ncbi:SOS response-associated peptidase family protein [Paenibacillus cremeus]|uniref:SOS response-associated peptidase family protein n=1 Tax=Paenibacillus cremeus TaxID=2163881 RepID=UPI0028F6C3C8|nr:SOS response-associated peptidase family protein [Paenibacillus cremeus]
MASIHDRMPGILTKEDEQVWLDPDTKDMDADALTSLLKPYPSEKMRAYPVSSIVGNVRNNP